MAIQIKFSSDLKKLLKSNDQDGLVPKVRKEFSKRGPLKIKQAIVQDMVKGISPVHGKGKWKRYSVSYKEVIRGIATFFRKGGKVIRIDNRSKVSQKELKALRASKQAKRTARNDLRSRKAFVAARANKFQQGASPTKKVSPVNLRYSGGLHKSLNVKTAGGFLSNFRLVVRFKNKLADIHNRKGAGKSKVIRRLLPTKNGEKFNRRITTILFDELKKAVNVVAKENNRQ